MEIGRSLANKLPEIVRQFNNRTIPHLRSSLTEIVFGIPKDLVNAWYLGKSQHLDRAKQILQERGLTDEVSLIHCHMVNIAKRRKEARSKDLR